VEEEMKRLISIPRLSTTIEFVLTAKTSELDDQLAYIDRLPMTRASKHVMQLKHKSNNLELHTLNLDIEFV
jgi:hypothetical protein